MIFFKTKPKDYLQSSYAAAPAEFARAFLSVVSIETRFGFGLLS
jgi:hypothetical protein